MEPSLNYTLVLKKKNQVLFLFLFFLTQGRAFIAQSQNLLLTKASVTLSHFCVKLYLVVGTEREFMENSLRIIRVVSHSTEKKQKVYLMNSSSTFK